MVSIITVNLNNLSGLKRTVDSVHEQTYRKFEHIVIDGGSTDGSAEFIKENASLFSSWVSETDDGVYSAMNKGIRMSRGEYLLFLNSGDQLVGERVLEDLSGEIGGEDLVFGWVKGEKGKRGKGVDFSFVWNHSLPHPATLIRRELFDRVDLYDESYQIISDWIFFMRALVLKKATHKYVDMEVAGVEDGGLSRRKGSLELIREEKKRFVMENEEIRNGEFVDRFFEMERQLGDLSRSRMMRFLVRLGLFRYLKDLFSKK